MEIEDTCIFRT